MNFSPINKTPFLRTSRKFPTEAQPLALEISKTYLDIANSINSRTIGIYCTNFSVVNGEQWYVKGDDSKQQALRRVYAITGAGSYAHGINFNNISSIVNIYGTFFDGSSYAPLPFVDQTSIAHQISVVVDPTNIVITRGATAPAIVRGYIILEWLSNP